MNKNNKLSSKQIAMLEKMDKQPITYDEDCPELTDNQIARIREHREIIRKYLAKKKKY